jgi:glycerol-3-phosphate dehydrogenase (NAD(P)+)
MSGALPKQAILVSLIKGIELSTGLRMSQVMAGDFPDRKICAVSGPNLVDEVISGHPSATVVASPSFQAAHLVQELLTSTSMRVYTNPDLVGVELAGATKNIVAISAGMAVGLGFGDNTRASLITRGLAEMTRLGTALGGNPATFAGLAGLGDLVATCASPASRNRRLGQKIAAGLSLAEIEEATPTVAEGARTSRAVLGLAAQAGVRMPIAERVAAVLWEGMKPVEAVAQLMDGRAGSELDMVPSEESV